MSEVSQALSFEVICRTRPPISEFEDVAVLGAAGDCGGFETMESSRFGYLSW